MTEVRKGFSQDQQDLITETHFVGDMHRSYKPVGFNKIQKEFLVIFISLLLAFFATVLVEMFQQIKITR